MTTKLEKLMFSIGLTDRFTGPSGKVMGQMDKMQAQSRKATANIATGALGAAGAVWGLTRALSPAVEQNRALGEVRSLGVSADALDKLNATSLRFAVRWGEDSAAVIQSAYDIQSAIAGLTGDELAGFTESSGILAKATKSDASTITNFVGTMFGIFEKEANAMGKQQWIEQLVGQSAVAVQMFKTTGTEMSSAFGAIGANATSMGVDMAEQIAILGKLQATMTGSEAGTKFKAFLGGAGKAQEALGLSFTDSQGKILPMVDILEKIKGKFGDIDTVAESDLFQKAFGRKEAVDLIKLLIQDTDGLAKNIDTIGQQTGMTRAMEMANAMIEPVDRLSQGGKAVRVAFGQILMRSLVPFISATADGANGVLRWIDLFPNLTRMLGIGLLAVTGLVVTIGLFSVAVGVGRFMMIGWGVAVNLAKGILFLFKAGLMLARGAMFLFNIALYLGGGALKALRLGFLSLVPGVWAFTAALLANPITWVVIGVVALIAAVVGLVVYWDQLVAVFSNNAWVQTLLAPVYLIIDGFKFLIDNFDQVGVAFVAFTGLFASINPFALLGESADWIISKLNLIPGIEISARVGAESPVAPVLASRQTSDAGLPPGGGVTNRISNAVSNGGKTVHIEKIEISSGGTVDGAMLANELEMAT